MRGRRLMLSLAVCAAACGAAEAGGRYYGEGSRYQPIGHSVSRFVPLWPGSEGAPYGTSALGGSVSVIQINRASDVNPRAASFSVMPGAAGPKIIDVESARLDRRPYGPDGLDIVYSGTTKIIRVSPDFRRARADVKDDVELPPAKNSVAFAKLSPAEQAVTVYPDPDEPIDLETNRAPTAPSLPKVARVPAPKPAPRGPQLASAPTPSPAPAPQAAPASEPAAGFEPWTDEWLRACVARYPNFDASLGTYTDEAGRRRFCTGDAAR